MTNEQLATSKKVEEYQKLALVSKAISSLIDAAKENNMPLDEMSELILSMAIRKERKNLPAFRRN